MNKDIFVKKINQEIIELESSNEDLNKELAKITNSIFYLKYDIFNSSKTVRITFHISIVLKQQFTFLLNIINEVDPTIIDNFYVERESINSVKEIDSHFPNFEEYKNFKEWEKFVENILDKMPALSIEEGKNANITKIQLMKTFAYSKLKNYANFSEPGSGKTITTLMSFFEKERQIGKSLRLLIVCPLNAINVWREEIINFTSILEEDIHIMREDFNEYNDSEFWHDSHKRKVIIINYHSAQKADKNRSTFDDALFKNNVFTVFDEVHRIKSGEGRELFDKSFSLSQKSKFRVILTGTPYSTQISELENLFKVNWAGQLPTISDLDFQDYSENITNREYSADKIKKLKEDLEPYYFRLRKKTDFGLEDAIDNWRKPIIVDDLEVQIKIDEFLSEKIKNLLILIKNSNGKDKQKDEENKKRLEAYYSYAQMNSVNPLLVKDIAIKRNIVSENDFLNIYFETLPKIIKSLKYVSKIVNKNEKIIVWMRYKENIEKFSELLSKNGINSNFIHGDIKHSDRESILRKFNSNDKELMVLVTNPDTLAESVSLHKYVHNSLFIERGFSYYQWAQAKDRIHRVGSEKDDIVTHEYIKSKRLLIDNEIFLNLSRKWEIDNRIFGELWIDGEEFSKNINFMNKLEEATNYRFGIEEIFDTKNNIASSDSSKDFYDSYDSNL